MQKQTMNDKHMTPQQAIDLLQSFDAELIKLGAEAVREVGSIKIMAETHEAALTSFAASGTGLLAATNASNFLRGLDEIIDGRSRAVSDATRLDNRSSYFVRLAEKQTASVQTAHFKQNAPLLATAVETIIAIRSKNREAWRERFATEIEKMERIERLETTMSEHDGRVLRARIESLEGRLLTADATYREAVRLSAALRTPSAGVQTLADAREFTANLSYE